MTTFTPATRALIYTRANQCCELCGKYAYGGSIHHRRPRGMGGDKRPETRAASNGVLLCGSGTTGCHHLVERNRAKSYDEGLLLRRHQDPSETPVLLERGWVRLDDNGLYLPAAA